MWRRRNNRDYTIGQPTLLETTVDDGYLETIHEVESVKSQRNSVITKLPDLPFRAVPPLKETHVHQPGDRTSSIYSQGSPRFPDEDPKNGNDQADIPDISPPSTPRSSADLAASDTSLVSPIDSTFNIPTHNIHSETRAKSQIPKRIPLEESAPSEPQTKDLKRRSQDRKTEETRWDDYSGEPTTNENGKKSTARPGEQPAEVKFPQFKERTRLILAGLRERDPKTRAAAKPSDVEDDVLDYPVQRPPWKGASGRTTLVEPVKNTPGLRVAPLNLPPRKQSLPVFNTKFDETASPQVTEATIRKVSEQASEEPQLRSSSSQDSIKPIVPLKLTHSRKVTPTEVESSIESPHSARTIVIESEKSQDPNEQNPSSTDANITPEPISEVCEPIKVSHPEREPALERDPQSGYSWKTYQSTIMDSPRSMTYQQMEESPKHSVPGLIIPRRRPVSTDNAIVLPFTNGQARKSDASLILRKPIANQKGRSASHLSTASMSKSLPPTPIELEAADKITTFEARLEDLARRKRNNQKINKELSADLRRNGISYGMKRRREIEKMIINLNLEIDEVAQEEHEIGMQLHRALKKRDKDNNYEQPTGLWIKRVTT